MARRKVGGKQEEISHLNQVGSDSVGEKEK